MPKITEDTLKLLPQWLELTLNALRALSSKKHEVRRLVIFLITSASELLKSFL